MLKPFTLNDAVDVVRKSRLVAEDRLLVYLDGLRTDWPLDPAADELFHDMVKTGLLTTFQAKQLENGRWMGFEIGNYRILDRLGGGGMGQVFLAEHLKLGNRVALKVLSRYDASPLARERFLREARAAAKLRHPNLIRVDDVNPNHDPPYIVMEYADGVTLQASVARGGTFDAGDGATVGQQVAFALEEANRHGLVHRDVKPANVLVDRRGVTRLLDLGIVRVDGENITSEYSKKVILGTIDYLSPEQATDSSNVDTRADIYSLGATLYFVYTGHPPLEAGTLRERLMQLQKVDPPHLSLLRPDLPSGLCEQIHRMLAKAPGDRPQTPAAAADALAPYAHTTPSFPAKLFKHQRCTLSDTSGQPTPPSGTVLPATNAIDEPTTEHHVVAMLPPAAPAPVPARTTPWLWIVAWSLGGLLALFGFIAIAFYIST